MGRRPGSWAAAGTLGERGRTCWKPEGRRGAGRRQGREATRVRPEDPGPPPTHRAAPAGSRARAVSTGRPRARAPSGTAGAVASAASGAAPRSQARGAGAAAPQHPRPPTRAVPRGSSSQPPPRRLRLHCSRRRKWRLCVPPPARRSRPTMPRATVTSPCPTAWGRSGPGTRGPAERATWTQTRSQAGCRGPHWGRGAGWGGPSVGGPAWAGPEGGLRRALAQRCRSAPRPGPSLPGAAVSCSHVSGIIFIHIIFMCSFKSFQNPLGGLSPAPPKERLLRR